MRNRNQKDEDDDFDGLFADLFEDGEKPLPNRVQARTAVWSRKILLLVVICCLALLAIILAVTGIPKY